MFKKGLLVLLLLMTVFTLSACNPGKKVPEGKPYVPGNPVYKEMLVNDDYTFIYQVSEMDGVFNPFFYSSAYDGDVIGMVNVGLLQLDPNGAVVAGDDYPTVALDYSIYYTNNLTKLTKKNSYQQGDYVVYDIILKNGAKFSDGTAITADDVLFNYYTYLDPAYKGSSTLYTLPIVGLNDYRTQVKNSAQFDPTVDALLADKGYGKTYVQNENYTQEQFTNYWKKFDEAGATFAQEIVTYVNSKYASDAYVDKYFAAGKTYADVAASENLKVAYGMSLWGYGEVSEDLTKFTVGETEYNVNELTAAVYFKEIMNAYGEEYQLASDTESAGADFVALAKELFVASYAKDKSVPTIRGLVKGTTIVNGIYHETVKIILTEQNPKAILSLGVTVAPKKYYTGGYAYKKDSMRNYGVEFQSDEFMAHLEKSNGAPMGAGPYKFVERAGDGTVYVERNENFYSMGGEKVHNALIKNVALKVVPGGEEYEALEAESGNVHYAAVSATSSVMTKIANQDKLASILVDNLGYGYIAVNPQVYNNLHTRIAIQSVFDLEKVYEYYPNGLADVIYRSQSQVSWAYPEGAEAIYKYDETLATAIAELKLAGYTFNDATGKFTDVPTVTFTIPSAADAHPAGSIFLKAENLLESIGVDVEVKVDAQLIANIKKGPVATYALAWQSSADPDMYQVYHYESAAESVISNGIKWLQENGNKNEWGTIEVTKLDGAKVQMNQAQALEYLAELIEEGTKYMLAEERAPIYTKALEVLAQLAIEVPTYQRKNLFVYNAKVLDATTLSNTVTPYWGPLAEIWKVMFVEGVEGNKTADVRID